VADKVVLVGMMGTGKTSVGRRVAAALGWRFVDSDEQIEARTGRTVREIFEADGEAAFRVLERDALAAALADPAPAVVAAAGGVVLDPANRDLLRDAGKVIWLTAEPEVLVSRVDTGDHRPLLAGDPLGTLRRLAAERQTLYRDVADEVVPVDEIDADAVAALIVSEL
jgi:shikimate kinase